jgi:hypothetical protein
MQKTFTPYPEVNAVLDVLLPDVQSILGGQFVGMYLYGSLAYGGFDRDSDVDFVVVTQDELSEPLFAALQEMHARVAKIDSWCATQLEGSYTPKHALRTFDPERVLYLHIDRGQKERLQKMKIENDRVSRAWWGGWVLLRLVLLESGITLAGPAPAALIDPVTLQELKQANLATLEGWMAAFLEDPAELASSGYQTYSVLTLCRILYTHERGVIVSKQAAAQWAQQKLGEPWTNLIERTWAGRRNPDAQASPEDIKATQDFIRYTLGKCS